MRKCLCLERMTWSRFVTPHVRRIPDFRAGRRAEIPASFDAGLAMGRQALTADKSRRAANLRPGLSLNGGAPGYRDARARM